MEQMMSYDEFLKQVKEGIVHREQFNEIPPHVEYSFTEKGKDLYPIFYTMMNWGYKYEQDFYGNGEDTCE